MSELSERGATREQLMQLEKTMKGMEGCLGENPFELDHYFAKGVYGRKLTIPKGHFVVGKIHKYSHIVMFLTGDITVVSEQGRNRIQAPYIAVSPAGAKRAFYAHEDTMMMTFHGTECEDIDKIEDELTCCSYDELPMGETMKTIEEDK